MNSLCRTHRQFPKFSILNMHSDQLYSLSVGQIETGKWILAKCFFFWKSAPHTHTLLNCSVSHLPSPAIVWSSCLSFPLKMGPSCFFQQLLTLRKWCLFVVTTVMIMNPKHLRNLGELSVMLQPWLINSDNDWKWGGKLLRRLWVASNCLKRRTFHSKQTPFK